MARNQGLQEEKHLNLSKAARVEPPDFDDTCEHSSSEACVWSEDICGLLKPIAQMGAPVRGVDVTEEER